MNNKFGKADFHIHSNFSDGVSSIKEILDYVDRYTDLDVISITDHDTVATWDVVQKWIAKKKYRMKVLPGIEITTTGGHLLGINVTKLIPKHQSLKKSIIEIHRQGGLAIIPHPLGWISAGVTKKDLNSLANENGGFYYLDGIELFNTSPAGRQGQKKASEFNRLYLQVAEIGASDAHNLDLIGKCYTLFPGNTDSDLFTAIKYRQTIAAGNFMSLRETLRLMKERNLLYRKIYKKFLRHKVKKFFKKTS